MGFRYRRRKGTIGVLIALLVGVFLLGGGFAGRAAAEDWPTFGHDNRRSCASSENPQVIGLREIWVYVSPHPPKRSWPEPERRDWYHKPQLPLKPRITFDYAFDAVAAGDAVFFGSSADGKLYCLDGASGKVRWVFYTEGPVRLAPSVWRGKVYFGSDDGRAYCLRASDGRLLWKYRPSEKDYRVPSDGALISLWPIRTGVLVDGGVAYFCAGLFPSEGEYLCALEAETGKLIWKKTRRDLSPQGYMLASPARLYVPMGRSVPVMFNRANGDFLGTFGGGGGAYALLADDSLLIYGPGRYTSNLEAFNASSKDRFATFEGNHIIVAGAMSYLHTDKDLAALDRARFLKLVSERERLMARESKMTADLKKSLKAANLAKAKVLQAEIRKVKTRLGQIKAELPKCVKWRRKCPYPYSLILAGDVLFAGGDGEVAAIAASDGATLWTAPVKGKVYGLAFANGRLLVSTDRGAIHCFASAKGRPADIAGDKRGAGMRSGG